MSLSPTVWVQHGKVARKHFSYWICSTVEKHVLFCLPNLPAYFSFYYLFVLFFNVRQSLCIVMTGMEPQNPERSICICLQSSKIKGMGPRALMNSHLSLETNVTIFFPFKAKLVSSLKSPSYYFIYYYLLGTHLDSGTSCFYLNKDIILFWDTKLSNIVAFKLDIFGKLWEVRCASREFLWIWSLWEILHKIRNLKF